MNRVYLGLCTVVTYGSLVPFAFSQQAPQPTAISEKERMEGTSPARLIILPSEMELARLLDLAAERVGVRIEYDPGVVRGSVALRSPGGLTDKQVWDTAMSALQARGFAAVMRGPNTYGITRNAEAASVAPVLDYDSALKSSGLVSVIFTLQNRSAEDVASALKPFLSKGVGLAESLRAGSALIVTDFADRIAALRTVLEKLDGEQQLPEIAEVPIQTLTATQALASVQLLIQKADTSSGAKTSGDVVVAPGRNSLLVIAAGSSSAKWKEAIALIDGATAVETRYLQVGDIETKQLSTLLTATVGSNQGEELRVKTQLDQDLGLLVATGTPRQLDEVTNLVSQLRDRVSDGGTPMQTFRIRNRPVNELLSVLQEILTIGGLAAEEDAGSGVASSAAMQRTEASNPEAKSVAEIASSLAKGRSTALRSNGVNLAADLASNSIVAVGSSRDLSRVASIIEKLDVRQPQVMLDVTLVGLSDNDSKSFGLELERLITSGDARIRVASLFGLSTSASEGVRSVGDSSGFTGSVLSPGEYNAVVRALRSVSKGRTTTMPRILVSNNEEATFSSVLQQPVITTNIISRDVTSTSFAGTQDAGTTIAIRPQLADGDHVVLQYSITISSFVGSSGSQGLPPPRQSNSLQSLATIPDSHTVVVGGLEVLADTQTRSSIPILGDIPVLGDLFSSQSKGVARSRFFALIRPVILRSSAFSDLKQLSKDVTQDLDVPSDELTIQPMLMPDRGDP